MKVSLITVVRNCVNFIAGCMNSVLNQNYPNIEYIIIDGKSTDGTTRIIRGFESRIHCFVSESDHGFYSALNRGIALATGEVIGILNADDVLADADVITTVVENFKNQTCDAVYGNLIYTKRHDVNQVIRTWRSKSLRRNALKFGWMPPHPTIYIRKEIYQTLGNYSMDYGHSSDYEFILRLFYKHRIKSVYVDKLFVKMRKGGISNGTYRQLLRAFAEDYRAMVLNEIPLPLMAIVGKKLRKIEQYF